MKISQTYVSSYALKVFVHLKHQHSNITHISKHGTGLILHRTSPPSLTFSPCTQWPDRNAYVQIDQIWSFCIAHTQVCSHVICRKGKETPSHDHFLFLPPNLPLSGPCQALFPGKGPSGQAQGPAWGRAWLIEKNKNREGRCEDSPSLHNSLSTSEKRKPLSSTTVLETRLSALYTMPHPTVGLC